MADFVDKNVVWVRERVWKRECLLFASTLSQSVGWGKFEAKWKQIRFRTLFHLLDMKQLTSVRSAIQPIRRWISWESSQIFSHISTTDMKTSD